MDLVVQSIIIWYQRDVSFDAWQLSRHAEAMPISSVPPPGFLVHEIPIK